MRILIIGEITDIIEIFSIEKKSLNSLSESNICKKFSLISEIFFLFFLKISSFIIFEVIILH